MLWLLPLNRWRNPDSHGWFSYFSAHTLVRSKTKQNKTKQNKTEQKNPKVLFPIVSTSLPLVNLTSQRRERKLRSYLGKINILIQTTNCREVLCWMWEIRRIQQLQRAKMPWPLGQQHPATLECLLQSRGAKPPSGWLPFTKNSLFIL